MSDDHFYPRAYARLSVIASTRVKNALSAIEGRNFDLLRDWVIRDLQHVLSVIEEMEAQQEARLADLTARVKALPPIIPVEVQ